MTGFARMGARLLLVSSLVLTAIACSRAASNKTTASAAAPSRASGRHSSGRIDTASLLTKEDASAALGVPVTSLDSSGESSVTYKTADPMFEAGLEAERKNDTADALLTMAGARKATGFLGGTPQPAAGLGDDAFYGAMSVLYVRSGDVVLTITPPNLRQVAQAQAYKKVTSSGDADSMRKAMEELTATTKNDPLTAGNSERDPAKAASSVIAASSKPQGDEYETKARAIGAELARKALARLGGSAG